MMGSDAPPPRLIKVNKHSTAGNSTSRRKTINIQDLFIEPNFHELDAVSTDSKEHFRRL